MKREQMSPIHFVGYQYMPPASPISKLHTFRRALKIGYEALQWEEQRLAWEDWTFAKLNSAGMLESINFDPTRHVGEALKLAQLRGVRLQKGLTFTTIRADMPDKWFGQWAWVDRFDICMAVCDCLIGALEDGVI
jgi:hypothetical protein